MSSEENILHNSQTEQDLEYAQFHRMREALYLWCARFFGLEIDGQAWEAMAELPATANEYLAFVSAADNGLEPLGEPLDDFICHIDERELDSVLLDLAREYAELFLGVGEDTVPLCESHYQSDSRQVDIGSRLQVKKQYQTHGLARSDDFKEPEDHLAMELSFMAHLCMRSQASLSTPQEGLREQLELQRDFLEHHLLAWVPSFRDKVSQSKKGGFYEIIANFTKRFIELDDSWLNQRLQKVDFAD